MGRRGRKNFKDECFFFITTTAVKHLKVFKIEECCDALIKNIKYYQKKYNFKILGYVIMPSHFHWILEIEPSNGTISDIMRDIKKYSAWDIMDIIDKLDKNDLTAILYDSAKYYKNQNRKFWMKRFDDEVIRNQNMFWAKLNYIHNNPVRAGIVKLPEEYKYSSARNYVFNDHSVIYVNTNRAGI